MSDPASAWFVRPRPTERAALRLFCLPHIGGSAMIFRTWQQGLPEWVEMCAVELPGRGSRIQEAPFSGLIPLVGALADAILPYLDRPFALFGHSFGALVCFELARALCNSRASSPALLFVSGSQAPQVVVEDPPMHTLPDQGLIDALRRLGGTPEAVLENRELVAAVLPAIRADYEAFETYSYTETRPFNFPIQGIGGSRDNLVDRASMQAWAQHTTAGFRLHMLPGDHFFIHRFQPQILQLIGSTLGQAIKTDKDG